MAISHARNGHGARESRRSSLTGLLDATDATEAPFDLSVDSGGDQFPVTGATPRLSWKVPSVAGTQRGYDLEARADGERLPSVSTTSASHLHVSWPWRGLASRRRIDWRVRTSGHAGPSDWSPWHSFEVGLLAEDWTAAWISPDEPVIDGDLRPAYELTTKFECAPDVVRARLYATALGVYEAFVNDTRAGTAELSPGATSYDRTLYAQASDVTSAIRAGRNVLTIVISDGWFRGKVGAFREPAGWGDTLAARAELHLDHADGTTTIVRTDGEWRSTVSAITRADLMDGQTTDFARTPQPATPVIVGAQVTAAIDWSPAPPVRHVETLTPKSVWTLPSGDAVVDFGQNASGRVRLTDLGARGTRTVLDFGEYVDASGDLSTSHLDGDRKGDIFPFVQRDVVISGGRAGESFAPAHTVHGFRYARIHRDGEQIDAAAVEMQVMHSDLRPVGRFSCSDDDLNRLHDAAAWSFRGNAVDIPTDCPTRERLGWTGDYQVFAPTAARLFDVHGFTRKWLRSVRDDQLDDGRIANFSPDGRRIKSNSAHQMAMMTGSAGWGDAITIVPWEMYLAYGDVSVLEENWDAMSRWVAWAAETARTSRHPSRIARSAEPEDHEHYIWDGSFHWGEWIEPVPKAADGSRLDPVKVNPMAWFMADKGEVGTAFLYRSTRILAETAAVLGREDDAVRHSQTAERIRDAWRREFLRDDGRTVSDTQASYVRALTFDLVPDDLRSAAVARLVAHVREAGNHLGTGFLSTGDLLPVLADHGCADIAYELLFQRSAPSWLYMIDHGATTIWEDWEGVDEHGDAHESLNHYSKGAVVRFLHTHTLGLRQAPGSVAWESMIIEPVPTPELTWARGGLDTPQGRADVAWEAVDGHFVLEVSVPVGSTAVVVLPDGTGRTVTAGTHRFEMPRLATG